MAFKLPELPFAIDALAPIMSKETLEYHYGKHHQAYVDKLNQLVQGKPEEKKSVEELVLQTTGPVFNQAAQVWNHTFFWNCLKPYEEQSGGLTRAETSNENSPQGELMEEIKKTFGSFEKFRSDFQTAGLQQFGSGWAWLVRTSKGELGIRTTSNAENPLRNGEVPLFVCDVWEHAYYIDYRNDRARFLQAVWKIVNWQFVEENFFSAKGLAA